MQELTLRKPRMQVLTLWVIAASQTAIEIMM